MSARRQSRSAAVVSAALWSFAAASPAAIGDNAEPTGTWSCVIYGHPALGDEHALLRFEADGATVLARLTEESVRRWVPLSRWELKRGTLDFEDFRTGRNFQGRVSPDRVGGTWSTETLIGGWWCGPADAAVVTTISGREVAEPLGLMPPLVPERMSMPAYPRLAIRAAKEGRAVACFTVDSSGAVVDPEIVELSDEIFRAPTLAALEDSRYRGWDDERVLRPGCRSFIYRLEQRKFANAATED